MHKALTWLEQSELQEKVHLEHQHCLKMKQEGWQRQEQKLGTEEVKSQEQHPKAQEIQARYHGTARNQKVPAINRTADKKGTIRSPLQRVGARPAAWRA